MKKIIILLLIMLNFFLSKSIYSSVSNGFGVNQIKCEVGDIIFFGDSLDDTEVSLNLMGHTAIYEGQYPLKDSSGNIVWVDMMYDCCPVAHYFN